MIFYFTSQSQSKKTVNNLNICLTLDNSFEMQGTCGGMMMGRGGHESIITIISCDRTMPRSP